MTPSAIPVRPPFSFEAAGAEPIRARLWLHVLLFALTLLTTTVMGARMQYNFDHGLPFFDVDRDLDVLLEFWRQPASLISGLPFSLTLLTILMAHELGHYLTCLFYRVQASLPYFLPAPSVTGTFGAFIRIHSPVYSKAILFDIGIAGPIAGFIFLLPALTVGLALSKVVPGINTVGSLHPGTPLILRFFEQLIFPGVATSDLYLHPVVRAGWVGLLATSMNLLPAGQLDGGHILYAVTPARHRIVTNITLALLTVAALATFQFGWLLVAVGLFFFGRRHPAIYDPEPVGPTRRRFALLALAIFVLSFMPAPI